MGTPRHDVQPAPRLGGDRGHHLVHQHLQPGGAARARACSRRRRSSAASPSRPWVKTSLAPGSKVVTDYLRDGGLLPYLEALGFHVVGYGCTTCIGNSGPLPDAGRRGRARQGPGGRRRALRQPQLRGPHQRPGADELPRLAAARRGLRARGRPRPRPRPPSPSAPTATATPCYLKDIWPTSAEVREAIRTVGAARAVPEPVRPRVRRRRRVEAAPRARRPDLHLGREVDLREEAPVLRRHAARARGRHRHRRGARPRGARRLGHHRPHLAGRQHRQERARRPAT